MTAADALLPLLCLLAATLYSSVGHAGASAYLASMALLGTAPDVMKPTALVLNLFVASITTFQFARAGSVEWRRLLPLVVGSIPAAFLAAKLPVPPGVFKALIAVVLAMSAVRLLVTRAKPEVELRPPHDAVALGTGAVIGALAGITGTGGGIFLTPIALFLGWADAKRAAGISTAFILVNSAAGLLGKTSSLAQLPKAMPLLVGAVVVGGAVGSTLGTRVFGQRALRTTLAVVLLLATVKLVVG